MEEIDKNLNNDSDINNLIDDFYNKHKERIDELTEDIDHVALAKLRNERKIILKDLKKKMEERERFNAMNK